MSRTLLMLLLQPKNGVECAVCCGIMIVLIFFGLQYVGGLLYGH
jgi:hypothetical protein